MKRLATRLRAVLFLLVAFALCVPAARAQSGVELPAPLVRYSFDADPAPNNSSDAIPAGRTVRDVSGNGRDALVVGDGVSYLLQGKAGAAFTFDGSQDYIEDADAGTYLNGLDSVSVSVWVRTTVEDTDRGIFTTVQPVSGGLDDVLSLRYDDAGSVGSGTNVIKGAIATTDGFQEIEGSDGSQDACLGSGTTCWQHIALVWETGQDLQLYVNGQLDTPSALSPTLTGLTDLVQTLIVGLGTQDEGASEGWSGQIDEFQIFDAVLSQEQINGLYTAVRVPNAGWRMLAPPVQGLTVADLAELNLVQGVPGVYGGKYDSFPPNLYTDYVESPGNDYVPASSATEALESGRGFIWYFYNEARVQETVPTPFTLAAAGPTVSGDFTVSGLDISQEFHLVGNPFPATFDIQGLLADEPSPGVFTFSDVVQIWDPEDGDYGFRTSTSRTQAARLVRTWHGFLVERLTQGSGTDQLVFDASNQVPDRAQFFDVEDPRPVPVAQAVSFPERRTVRFSLIGRNSGDEIVSRDGAAMLSFVTGATDGVDRYDASKLTPLSASYATVAFESARNGEPWMKAAESRAYTPAEAFEVPVAFTNVDGGSSFTLSWPTMENIPDTWTVTLTDRETGSTVDLQAQSEYTFTDASSGGTSAAPQALRGGGQTPTLNQPVAMAPSGETPRFVLSVEPAALPVELSAFTARADDADAVLEWQTTSETNNAGFAIEHRAGSGAFREMAFVDGHGTTTEAHAYRYRAEDLAPGSHTFRLRQVDLDGTKTLVGEQTVTLEMVEPYRLEGAYPNPFRSRATVKFAVRESQPVTVALYDMLGRRVRTLYEGTPAAEQVETVRIEGSGLSSGLYVVRLEGESFQDTQRVTLVK